MTNDVTEERPLDLGRQGVLRVSIELVLSDFRYANDKPARGSSLRCSCGFECSSSAADDHSEAQREAGEHALKMWWAHIEREHRYA